MQQCFMFIDTGNGTGWTPVNDSTKDVAALDSFTIEVTASTNNPNLP